MASIPLSFNSILYQKPFLSPLDSTRFPSPVISKSSILYPLSKSHICFTFSPSSSTNYDREESRWLREEQRWLREEQRWLREESRWNSEKESLLRQISELKLQILELERQNATRDASSVTKKAENIVNLLRIAESGTSAAPLVVEAAATEAEEEVVVKEVVRVSEGIKEVKKKRNTLRIGSEGDEVRAMQEALQKVGFYSGEEDMEFSSFSSGTERAVKTWQASIGAPESGIMTSELLERLFMGHEEAALSSKVSADLDGSDKLWQKLLHLSKHALMSLEGANGAVIASKTEISKVQQEIVKESGSKAEVSEHRVFLLGENRWEDSSRLTNRGKQAGQSNSRESTTKCLSCRGEGRLLCTECDGTGEPNIEPQFLEWVDEEMKCPYCEGHGYTVCDVCEGKAVTSA